MPRRRSLARRNPVELNKPIVGTMDWGTPVELGGAVLGIGSLVLFGAPRASGAFWAGTGLYDLLNKRYTTGAIFAALGAATFFLPEIRSLIKGWPTSNAPKTQAIAYLPSVSVPSPVSLTQATVLKEGDNGAFLLAPTRDFFWVKVPDKVMQMAQNDHTIGDAEFYAGDFQVKAVERGGGELYLTIPPESQPGERGSVTVNIGKKGQILWQATVTLVAA